MAPLHEFADACPQLADDVFLAPSASVIGQVTVGAGCGIFYGAVVRGDSSQISIGEGSNVQDNVVIHADPGFPARIGNGVSIGHGAIVHGCSIADDCLIGMSATVMNGAIIGTGSLIAAGAVVLEGTEIPPRSLVAGVPAKVRRQISESELDGIRQNAMRYRELSAQHRGHQER
ncbi:gamma carbonic anhydrase family protein [Acaricomes phytoseiuli]|uniref:gamma carbonic anhydrase family protein n=1 Tax=Acaricomes phytoseiuli TaxID=291968 RepID=UPI0003624D6A|nr:gamma carbonic anhydrase family protein [Acaricomes phytoseiuli]MCW1248958.1 gamma carbonic anhydrase family protein [Acaricomes phytoseiuli]